MNRLKQCLTFIRPHDHPGKKVPYISIQLTRMLRFRENAVAWPALPSVFCEWVFVLVSFPLRCWLSGAIRIGRVGMAVEPGALFLLMCLLVLLTWLAVPFHTDTALSAKCPPDACITYQLISHRRCLHTNPPHSPAGFKAPRPPPAPLAPLHWGQPLHFWLHHPHLS